MNKTGYIAILRSYSGLIAAAFLLMLFSGFGQSVFIGVFLPDIQHHFGINKTALGSLYAAATITSAALMIWSGKLLDRLALRNFIMIILAGLALGCILFAMAFHPLMLFPAFLCLRQFGQGLMTPAATTVINRYIEIGNGRAQSVAQMGLPVHAALFPLCATMILGAIGFTASWIAYAAFIVLILMPFFWFFLRAHEEKTHKQWSQRMNEKAAQSTLDGALPDEWTRRRVLRDWRFYIILSVMLIGPCFGTAIFFYQTTIAESLSMAPALFTTGFIFLTGASILSALIAGPVMDNYGEKYLLTSFPILYAAGLVLLSGAGGLLGLYSALSLIGAAGGIMSITGGPLFAKMYGTKHFASIKSLNFMAIIIASAISPPLCGLLLDSGFEIGDVLFYFALYSALAWIFILLCIQKITRHRKHAV